MNWRNRIEWWHVGAIALGVTVFVNALFALWVIDMMESVCQVGR